MLEIRGVRAGYGNREVLKGVSMVLREGVGCLLGPNGAGKTTLLRCVAGLLRPWAGKVLLDGADVHSMSLEGRTKVISYVPQEFSIRFPYTVFEVVLMGRNPHVNILRGPGPEDEEAAWRALEALGIERLAWRRFTDLSGGEKRLALIARALAQGGKLMILDEPTAFLDFRNQVRILEMVSKLTSSGGREALLSLHDPNHALLYCGRVCVLNGGEVVAEGSAREVITEEVIEKVYGVRVVFTEVGGRRILVPLRFSSR